MSLWHDRQTPPPAPVREKTDSAELAYAVEPRDLKETLPFKIKYFGFYQALLTQDVRPAVNPSSVH
jgi:hypothetical protein